MLILKLDEILADGAVVQSTSHHFMTSPPMYNEHTSDLDSFTSNTEMAQLVLEPENTQEVFPTNSIPLETITISGYEHVTFNTS